MLPPDAAARLNRYLREVAAVECGTDVMCHWVKRRDGYWLCGIASRAFVENGDGRVFTPVMLPFDGGVPTPFVQ